MRSICCYHLFVSTNKAVLIVSLVAISCPLLGAHIVLTYPIPRRNDFDFQDMKMNPPPCGGEPKGPVLSEFRKGETVQMSWHLSTWHKGGFRVELLLDNDNVSNAIQLLPSEQILWDGEETPRGARVQLPPEVVCDNCTLRVVRQALDLSPNKTFYTCADIRIADTPSTYCSARGRFIDGRCLCDHLHFGSRCQFWDECESSSDCGHSGVCADTLSTLNPRRQCFCPAGVFSERCEKKSPVIDWDSLDLALYNDVSLSPDLTLYYHIEADEIEMVIIANTTTWLGIGWKPVHELQCQDMKTLDDGNTGISDGYSMETSADNSPTEQSIEYKGSDFLTTDAEYLTALGLDPAVTFQSCKPHVSVAKEPYHTSTCPMDCTDMVLMAAVGRFSRINDAFSRDRSTPKYDSFYGGKNNLLIAGGQEASGKSSFLIRKKLKAVERSDHSIEPGPMAVVWALGQSPLSPKQLALQNIWCDVKDTIMYSRQDVPTYHGKANRGSLVIDFFKEQSLNSNKFERDDNNGVTWSSQGSPSELRFTIKADLQIGDWMAVGFAEEKRMPGTDMYLIGVTRAGEVEFSGRYAVAYSMPQLDRQQTATAETFYQDGKMKAVIRRKVTSGSPEDVSLDKCRFVVLVQGTAYHSRSNFSKHNAWNPLFSSNKMCFIQEANSYSEPHSTGTVWRALVCLLVCSLVWG